MAKKKSFTHTKDEKNVSSTRTTTIRGVAKNKEFNIGYADFKAGVWRKEYETWHTNAQWQYERGRAYAAAGGPPIKSSYDARVLRNEALSFINNMLYERAMI